MAVALKRSEKGGSNFSTDDVQITDLENVVDVNQQNVRVGPTTLRSFHVDNEVAASAIGWVKFFDLADTTWVAGTSRPVLVMRCRATSQLKVNITGSEDGFRFENGCSLWWNETVGDVNTTASTQQVDFYANFKDG
jgi:hypothetical protein